jgi:hypothetical protein
MKPLLTLALLLCCLAAHAKGKAKIKIDTTPNPTENVWTITNELNYYHDTAQQMQDTLYNNVTIDYSAQNGWDIQLASYNIPLTGGGAQNYQTDTYLNVSKTFNITHDFQAIIGSQNGTTIPHSLNPRQLHNADYSLVVYQPDAQLNLHVGPYWVNKALATTTDVLGYTGGFSIEVIPKLLIFQGDYFSGHNNLSGAVVNAWVRIHPQAQVYFGVGVPEHNSGNEFYGTLGFSVANK